MSENTTPQAYTPQPRKVGMFGEVNNFVSSTIKETGNSASTVLRTTRKALTLGEIALDEATVDMQESYLLRRIEVEANLGALGYSPDQVQVMLKHREV